MPTTKVSRCTSGNSCCGHGSTGLEYQHGEGSEVPGHPQLDCEFEVTLGYDETFFFLKHLFKTMP